LVSRRDDVARGSVRDRGDDERAPGERETDGNGVARVVQTQRAGLEDEGAPELVGDGGPPVTAAIEKSPPGVERRCGEAGTTDGGRV
jgi:hypothetical protein